MKSSEHFMQMLLGLPEWETGREQQVTIEELARLLCCTPRNVKLILRKWEQEGLLRWKAGVGRGNHSTLTILCDITRFLRAYMEKLLTDGKVGEAVALIGHKNMPLGAKRLLQDVWNSQFGFVAEKSETDSVDVLRIPRQRAFATLDPAFVAVAAECHFIRQMCHTLVVYDEKTQSFVPQLAYAWESNDEMTAWTFYLRKGVRFHHGRLLTGKDVEHTVLRLLQLDSPYSWQMEDVERIEHKSDRTITFHLRKPNGFFLHFAGSIAMSILPHDVPFSERSIVGTGPFRMAEYTDERLVLEAFDDYYRERAFLDRVEIWIVPGLVFPEMLYQLPEVEPQQASTGTGSNLEFQEAGCHYLAFNFTRNGVQHDYAFRKAMRLVVDRVQLIRDLPERKDSPAGSFLPGKSRTMSFAPTSLEEAAAWLGQSAYRGETLHLFFSEGRSNEEEAEWIQNRCRQIGIQLKLTPVSKSEFLSDHVGREADMAIMGEVLQRDTELGLIEVYKNKCTLIHRFLDDEKRATVEQILSDVLRLPEGEQRMAALERIEEKLNEELWLLFNYHVKRIDRYHPALQGVSVDSFGWVDFSKLWVKPSGTS